MNYEKLLNHGFYSRAFGKILLIIEIIAEFLILIYLNKKICINGLAIVFVVDAAKICHFEHFDELAPPPTDSET
ncbi:hypothetical protein BpHYR1_032333 [Brachionus plicatilis]|uniref:Uncharacterized protein n=1 Tax=Brachionus plicatilis TaxID=10195 RepID=A0A3M7S1A2_BRAPC|nr:hypothetical protein BpHYR1_032333 [Brachionus plicatilis]